MASSIRATQAKKHLGIDQYGGIYHLGKYPRKALVEQLGGTPKNVYVDRIDGSIAHIGYCVRDVWVDVFEIQPANLPDRSGML